MIPMGVRTRTKTAALPGSRRPVWRGGDVRTIAVRAARRVYVGEPPEYNSREANRADAALVRVLTSPAPRSQTNGEIS